MVAALVAHDEDGNALAARVANLLSTAGHTPTLAGRGRFPVADTMILYLNSLAARSSIVFLVISHSPEASVLVSCFRL